MNVLKVDSKESIKDIATRLLRMLETIDSEVSQQVEITEVYLTTCCVMFADMNPMARLIPSERVVDFASTVLRLGYYLAKKPWELEAQLNELKATYGTVPYEEDNNGKITS